MTAPDQSIADQIGKLREHRVREAPDRALAPSLTAQAKLLKKSARATASIAKAWSDLCPEHLLPRTAIVGVHRGTLTLAADDAAARFEVDRLLRSGIERQLLKSAAINVRRVRVVIAADNEA